MSHGKAPDPLLAIDTANRLGSVAVGTPDRVLAELTIGASARHAESLLPAIDLALRQAGVKRTRLRGLLVGAGPGSFTGVRIAAATAKAIARALEVPLFAHSSLAVVAAGAGVTGRAVGALFDARRGEVYAACYQFGYVGPASFGRVTTLLSPCTAPVREIVDRLAGYRPLWVGEGALRYADALRDSGTVAPAVLAVTRASSLLWLHGVDREEGLVRDLRRWVPDYIRAPAVVMPAPAYVSSPREAGRQTAAGTHGATGTGSPE